MAASPRLGGLLGIAALVVSVRAASGDAAPAPAPATPRLETATFALG